MFTSEAQEVLRCLSKQVGDGKIVPQPMPLKPWPKEERDKVLQGILKLNYLNDQHREEWQAWFAELSEVRDV